MAQRARTNKNTSLATSNGSGYNKKNGGSYTGSTTGLSAEKSPLNTQKTDFAAPKKTTITPKKTEENYFQKARETQRELSKPLPRINDAPKKDESNFSLSTGSALKSDTKTTNFSLSDDAAKRYNLPTTTERDFGKGLFDEKEEQNLYNKMVYEIFGPKKTERQLFLEGFEGKEQEIPEDISYLVPKQDIQSDRENNLKLPLETIPKSRMEAFAKIRDEKASQNAKPQFHTAYKPENKKVELDPNVRIIPTPKADYTKEWRAAEPKESVKISDKELAEGISGAWSAADKVADVIEEPYKMYEKMRKVFSNPATINISHTGSAGTYVRSLSNTIDGSHILSKVVKNGGKAVSRVSAATGIVSVLDFSTSTWADYEESGNIGEAVAQNLVRVGVSEGAAVLGGKAGMQAGAYIGSLICPFAGTLIGGAIGYLGGRLIGGWIGDEIGDSIGEWIVGWFD